MTWWTDVCLKLGMVTFETVGFEKLARELKALGPRVGKSAKRVVRGSANQLKRDIKAAAPVDKGDLAASITARVANNGLTAVVSTDDETARLTEFGGRRQDPQPYFLPTAAKAAPRIGRAIELAVTRALKK